MKKHTLKKQKAFTIVETLVAIFLLSLSITGPLFYVSNTFQLARISKYQMTAYFLATETLEEIKFKRDTILGNTVPGSGDEDSWIGPELLGLQTSQGGPAEYFDWDKDGNDFFSCNDSAPGRCPYLDFDSEYGYMYDGGSSPSVFYRHTQILETGSPSERQIIVTVGWNDGIISGELDVFEYIYDFNI